MKITLVNPRSFCFGVQRALDMLDSISDQPTYVLHEIIHNKSVIEKYKQKGFIFVNDLADVPNGCTLVFSAHGVAKNIEDSAKAKNLKIIDTTCPFVKKVHTWVKKLERERRTVILIGKKNHAEIIGTLGQLENPQKAFVVISKEEIEALPDLNQIGIATQTTLSIEETQYLITFLKAKYPNCLLQTGICQATTERQKALQLACQKNDTVLVVGDKSSSNCMRLLELAKKNGCKAFLIEKSTDINGLDLGENIAITAAASAPEEIVQEIVLLLQSNRH